ncbi:MAG: nucleotidyltransferase domain-containing protein [Deltaproteobacteria bacterium]|nr:nucleotidyltransferase domain-containing protein [Deltaproteobacteria bacterium]
MRAGMQVARAGVSRRYDRIDWGRRVPSRTLERLLAAASRVCAGTRGVELAWLHGSAVRGGRCRDLDLGLVVRHGVPAPWDVAAAVRGRLEGLDLPSWVPRSPVPWDVRALTAAGPAFLFRVISTGRCIFERSAGMRVSFEAQVMSQWLDFRPVWEEGLRRVFEGPVHGW